MLDEVLKELQENSEKTFLNVLQSHVNNKLIRVEAPPRDLSPTPGITSLLALLKDMLSTANMSEGRESDMGKVVKFYQFKFFVNVGTNLKINTEKHKQAVSPKTFKVIPFKFLEMTFLPITNTFRKVNLMTNCTMASHLKSI